MALPILIVSGAFSDAAKAWVEFAQSTISSIDASIKITARQPNDFSKFFLLIFGSPFIG
jgi:hypothetical protein